MSNSTYSRQTLEETPARTLTFLRAIGTSAEIRAALAERGYSAEEHAQGWDLLHNVAGYPQTTPNPQSGATQQAIETIDAWDEPTFRIAQAALARLHPEQAAFVFDHLQPATGAAAVLTVRTFLERLDALENSPERIATRTEDLAALGTLEKRGITKAERQRMQQLLDVAQGLPASVPQGDSLEVRLDELRALRAWFDDWTQTARIVITRRDQLIRLGLAKRKKSSKPVEPVASVPPAP